jgi:hypothetical protein
MITFNNQEERMNFQIIMCLQMLKSEVETGMIMCSRNKGSTVRTLAKYFPGLKRTKKGAYKQLVDAGIYKQLEENNVNNN